MVTGVIVCVAVLAAASAFGMIWKTRNGRLRTGAPAIPVGGGRRGAARTSVRRAATVTSVDVSDAAGTSDGRPAAAVTSVGMSDAAGTSDGRPGVAVTSAGRPGDDRPAVPGGEALTEADLGRPLGGRATLVQFSTAFCAPCRATRVILADVAGLVDGVAYVEIDAEHRLDLVRRLDIRRTPAVLVLGPDGRIARRGSGQPRKADLIAALGEVITPGEVG